MSLAKHEWVEGYNWDDGIDPMRVLVDSPATAFATALLIYWRLGGPWLETGTSHASAPARALQHLVKQRLLSGFYAKSEIRYDPIADNQLSHTQVYQLTKAGFPRELLAPQP